MINYIIVAVVALAVVLVIRSAIKNRGKGCGDCTGCGGSEQCPSKQE